MPLSQCPVKFRRQLRCAHCQHWNSCVGHVLECRTFASRGVLATLGIHALFLFFFGLELLSSISPAVLSGRTSCLSCSWRRIIQVRALAWANMAKAGLENELPCQNPGAARDSQPLHSHDCQTVPHPATGTWSDHFPRALCEASCSLNIASTGAVTLRLIPRPPKLVTRECRGFTRLCFRKS